MDNANSNIEMTANVSISDSDKTLKSIREFVGADVQFIEPDQTFNFECQQCGRCCKGRTDIILSPFDVYRIAKHEFTSCEKVIQKYCITDLGAQSRIPMVLLNCDMGKTHQCGFLDYDFSSGKYKCRIHDCSPGACANHPIGTVFQSHKEGPSAFNPENIRFIKVEQCDNSKNHDHPVLLKDWTKDYMDHFNETMIANQIKTLVSEFFDMSDFITVMSFMDRAVTVGLDDESLSDEDKGKMRDISALCNTVVAMVMNGTIDVGYTRYDTHKDFIPQAEENIKELRDVYGKAKTTYDSALDMLGCPKDANVKDFIMKEAVMNNLVDESLLPPEALAKIKEYFVEKDADADDKKA